MARLQLSVSIPEKMLEKINEIVEKSNGKYNNRSHFIQLAIREKFIMETALLEKENAA